MKPFIAAGALLLITGCSAGNSTVAPLPTTPTTSTTASTASASTGPIGSVPKPDHVVVVMEENHSYGDIVGSADAPYLNALAGQGALFTSSFAVAHPSEPNYVALFSGSTQGLTDDSCPHTFAADNLGAQLSSARLGFTGYSEDLPSVGDPSCTAGGYARKHSPWSNFPTVPAADSQPFSAFPTDYSRLPAVSFVIPNLTDDMHDGTIAEGDTWLRSHLDGYAQWAKAHHSLLIVTWDEDDYSQANQIPTMIVGQQAKPGRYGERIDHYSVLRTLETMYGLPALGQAASAAPITDCWSP
ncbi:MAG TPA: alkaline phosphatase family protein [Pseudonocardiaceae bacterium]|jgi:acid phosphatase|nr:alkaline phosphatase family protein [Pseudonocardiaceae bacterium]